MELCVHTSTSTTYIYIPTCIYTHTNEIMPNNGADSTVTTLDKPGKYVYCTKKIVGGTRYTLLTLVCWLLGSVEKA